MSTRTYTRRPRSPLCAVSQPGDRGGRARLAAGQEGGEGLALHRSREEIALRGVAAELAQALELDLALDALGDDLQTERPGDVDDGGDDRGVLVLGSDAVHERAVDLDDVQ